MRTLWHQWIEVKGRHQEKFQKTFPMSVLTERVFNWHELSSWEKIHEIDLMPYCSGLHMCPAASVVDHGPLEGSVVDTGSVISSLRKIYRKHNSSTSKSLV